MKKRILPLLAGLLCAWHTHAQFQPASIPEFFNPGVSNVALDANNTNCHSYGNIQVSGGDIYNIYVHTFEGQTGFSPPYTYNWGLAWTLENLSTPGTVNGYVSNVLGANVQLLDMDVAIVQQTNGDVQFAVAYLRPTIGYYVAFLKLNAPANTVTLVDTIPLMSTAGSFNTTGINIDVNESQNFVITFGLNDRIYACGGVASAASTPTLGSVIEIATGSPSIMPDVALCNSVNSGLNAHFVYQNHATGFVEEAMIDFNTINTATSPVTPTIEDVSGGLVAYTRPRIDCPDHVADDSWSYVVMGEAPPAHVIEAAVKDPSMGGIYHARLNDGSLPPSTMDITPNKNYYPVVAYDRDPNFIHFSWVTSGLYNIFGTTTAYIGLMVSSAGLLNNDYWAMEMSPAMDIKILRSVALSGQNDQSPELYATMTYTDAAGAGDFINCKMVPWTFPSFKPTGIGASGTHDLKASISPNPATAGFTLDVRNAGTGQQFTVQLTDIGGRRLMSSSGNLDAVKDALYKGSAALRSGIYFVHVEAEGEKGSRSFKVVKE